MVCLNRFAPTAMPGVTRAWKSRQAARTAVLGSTKARKPSSTVCPALGKYAPLGNSSTCPSVRAREIPAAVGQSACLPITSGHEGIGGSTENASHPGHMAEVPCSAGK